MTKELVINALKHAIERYNPSAGIIQHSERGTHYLNYEYGKLLKKHGFI